MRSPLANSINVLYITDYLIMLYQPQKITGMDSIKFQMDRTVAHIGVYTCSEFLYWCDNRC